MILGIDASNLRAGGGVTHLVEFLRAAEPHVHCFERVIVWGCTATLLKIEEQYWLCKVQDALLDRGLLYRVFWQRFRLKKLAKDAGCDVLFVPGGSDASGFKPMATMSRNLLPFELREMRRYGLSSLRLKLALLRITQSMTFRKADAVIFLTHYARETVQRITGPLPGKIATIPHGIDPRFFCTPRPQRKREEFNESNPCRVLYVSIVDAYKHQSHVAEAVAQLRKSGFSVTLDLVGPAYAPAMCRLNQTLRRVDPGARFIHYRGAVLHEEVRMLYAAADINVFASSCENMPNILLESMACGLPIACSNRGPMPEVLREAGVYFDPEQPGEIADAIRSLIESSELRLEKAQAAYERAQQFSWARCADETLAFLATIDTAQKR
jgi:glycosyltransferase involved in cell wall biosynthesis